MDASQRAGRRLLVTAVAVTALVASGATYALAAGKGGDGSDGRRTAALTTPAVTANSKAGPCKVGFDTETGSLIPPDDSTTDKAAAGTVQMKKQCAGGCGCGVLLRGGGDAEGSRVHSLQMVFSGLKRGAWKFEVLPGSPSANAFLGFRTFTVTAYNGG